MLEATVRKHQKLLVVFSLGIAIVAMLLLAVGLSRLDFLPGRPFSLESNPPFETGQAPPLPAQGIFLFILRAVYFLVLALLPILIIWLIVSPEARKAVLKQLLRWLPIFIILYLTLGRLRGILGTGVEPTIQGVASPTEGLAGSSPTDTFVSNSSQWLVLAVSLGVAVLLTVLVASIAWSVWRRRRPRHPLERLAQEAQNALDALWAGGDLKNVVIRCYLEMNRVVSAQRGIRRDEAMTPREFEHYLEEKGLPREPVRQLTQLFEEVRYGTLIPGENEKRQAVASLTAIVEVCGGAV
jgi:Domain of unknown function (DUF4129)